MSVSSWLIMCQVLSAVSRDAQLANGYGDIETLVDTGQVGALTCTGRPWVRRLLSVMIAIVRMNEDYKDGVKLTETLQALP